ncbi:MAG: PAS domain S-box protein [Anaerolineae bacterium]|nr:PAS domain S-box protein [Anaerolineae bacterium]
MIEPETAEASKDREVLHQRIAELEAQLQQARAGAEKQLRFTEALLAAIPTPVFFKDAEGRYLGCNDAFAEQMGVTAAEMKGKTVHDLWPSEHADVYHEKDLELLQHPHRQLYESVVRDKHGRDRNVIFAKNAFYDETGQTAGLVGAYVDITERKQIEAALVESERRYRLLAENATDVIWTMNMNWQFTYVSPAIKRLRGYDAQDAITQPLEAILTPAALDRASETFEEALALERQPGNGLFRSYTLELEMTRKDGPLVWTETTATFLRDSQGKPVEILGVTRDITERKRAEQILQNRLAYEHLLSHLSSMAANMTNLQDFYEACLPAMGQTLGVSRAYIFEHRYESNTMDNTAEWCAPGIAPQKENLQNIPADSIPWWVQTLQAGQNICFADIEEIPDAGAKEILRDQDILSIWVVPLFVAGQYFGFLGFDECRQHREWPEDDANLILSMSLTIASAIERRQAEEALRASEERYRSLIENSNDAIYLLYGDRFEIINARFAELFGVTSEEVRAPDFDFTSLVAPRSRPLIAERQKKLALGEEAPARYEFTALNRAGQEIEVEVSVSHIAYRTGVATQGILRDIGEHKRMVQALRESEERFRTLADNIPGVVYLCSNDARYSMMYLNKAVEHLTGYPSTEFLEDRISFVELYHPDDAAGIFRSVDEALEKRAAFHLIYRLHHKDGAWRWVEEWGVGVYDGDVLRFLEGFLADITERKVLETQLRRQEQLAAIGQLAAGIAHDFRNLLTTIILYAQLGQRNPDLPPTVAHYLETIVGEAHKATDLVKQILDFARRTEIDRQPLDLVAFVGNMVGVLKRILPETIHITFDVESGPCIVEGDAGRLQQVLTNLALNARDAMPNGGALRIGLAQLPARPGNLPEGPAASMPPAWICLSVADTGAGMSEEVRAHLFEPFFTTKEAGKGTGLGLAQVYGIVQLHAGYIDVDSEVGQGAIFRIYLPMAAAAGEETDEAAFTTPPGHGETLLLVEDNAHLREAGASILTALGYRVLTAADGHAALALFETTDAITLLITDLVMPEMGGKALVQLLRVRNPHLKALVMTGHATEDSIKVLRDVGFQGVIRKPFDAETLAQAVRRALDEGGSQTPPHW